MKPIALHPDNPRYFLFRDRPAVLVTSGEHYGAVLNLDFDFEPYLDELEARGLNLTRTFSGTYREVPGSFKIRDNTLAPLSVERFACPWARSETPGAGDGGPKFDLGRWNDAYFRRLREFVAAAGRRGIVVELVLWCTVYEDDLWNVSPMNPRNNVQGAGPAERQKVLTLENGGLLRHQEELVRKIAAELRDADNLYYEVCNEPYFHGVSPKWQDHIAAILAAAESGFPARHLIARNIANGSEKVPEMPPHVSILNFHYAAPPDAVPENYALNRPIGFDETGFKGTGDRVYRTEGWDFLLAGGAVYSHLDYSFTPQRSDGSAPVEDPTPGGGGRALREQLGILKSFLERFDLPRLKPDPGVVRSVPAGMAARALSEPGRQYAIYLKDTAEQAAERTAEITLDVPAGRYRLEWLDTRTGKDVKGVAELEGPAKRVSPPFREDVALRIVRE